MKKENKLTKYWQLVPTEDKKELQKKQEEESEWQGEVERVYQTVDRPLLIVVILLVCLGAITLLSASFPYAIAKGEATTYYFTRTLAYIVVGVVIIAALCALREVMGFFKKVTVPLYVVTVALLVAVLFIGRNLNGAKRSFSLGPVSVQPSEIAKFVLILALAWYCDKIGENIRAGNNWNRVVVGLLYPGVIFGVFTVLILAEKHLSCVVLMSAIFFFIMLLSGVDHRKLIIFCLIAAIVGGGLYLATHPYAVARIKTLVDDDPDKFGEAWQTSQGLYAIGNGGLLGLGLGRSALKFSYISEPMNDFIFAVFCEELGFVGALVLITLFGLFVWRGIRIALRARDKFSQLVAFGITVHIGIQAVFNILVVTDIFPNTGISLPFFSFGGSALLMQMTEAGILLAISKHTYVKKKKVKE